MTIPEGSIGVALPLDGVAVGGVPTVGRTQLHPASIASTTCRSPRVTSGTSFKTISWEMGERQSTASRGVNRLAVIKSDF